MRHQRSELFMLSSMKRVKHKLRRIIVHALRVGMLVGALCLIRYANRSALSGDTISLSQNPIAITSVAESVGGDCSIQPLAPGKTWQPVETYSIRFGDSLWSFAQLIRSATRSFALRLREFSSSSSSVAVMTRLLIGFSKSF